VAKVPADPADSPATEKPVKAPKRKKSRRDSQMDLFGGAPPAKPAPQAPVADVKPELKPEEDKSAPARRLPAPAPVPVNAAQLRKAVNEILPLLTDQDPGANDCLKANHVVFCSAFVPESYAEFGQLIENGQFGGALELLKKVARKQGIPV
jgi:hypothetical protein